MRRCTINSRFVCTDWLSIEKQAKVLELLTNAEISILKKKEEIRQYTPSYQIPGVSSLGRRPPPDSHHNIGIDVCASDDSSTSTQEDDMYLYASSVGLLDDDSQT